MSWCGVFCDTADDAIDFVAEGAEDGIDDVTSALVAGIEVIGGFIDDATEWVEETGKSIGEFVANTAEAVWDWVTETGSSVWEWVKRKAGDVWEWTTGLLEDAWEWVRETANDAWDRLSNAAASVWGFLEMSAEAIGEFVEERVVPFLLDALWVLTHVDDFLVAGIFGIACLLSGQDEKEYNVIEGLFRLDEEVLSRRKVAFLPSKANYVLFSDHHMFLAGDPLDRFRQLGNHELYSFLLASYGSAGYTLIENGDVEDLWMREVTLGGALFDEATDILGWPFGVMLEEDYEDNRIRSQAVRIFANNADIYQIIRNLFHDTGHYVRLVGNHDDYWRDGNYLPALQMIYPGLEVQDYVFMGNYGNDRRAHDGNSPELIIAHGHQWDAWNNAICRAAGEALTEVASGIPSLAASFKERAEWEEKLSSSGFDNELSDSWTGVDEVEFYETIEKSFSNHPYVPDFILGHTHHALKDPQIPGWMYRHEWNFAEYTNSGTTGRWEQFIWGVTIEEGSIALRGWTWGADGGLRMFTFGEAGAGRLQAA